MARCFYTRHEQSDNDSPSRVHISNFARLCLDPSARCRVDRFYQSAPAFGASSSVLIASVVRNPASIWPSDLSIQILIGPGFIRPKGVANATSAASRPIPIRTKPSRAACRVPSNSHQRPHRKMAQAASRNRDRQPGPMRALCSRSAGRGATGKAGR